MEWRQKRRASVNKSQEETKGSSPLCPKREEQSGWSSIFRWLAIPRKKDIYEYCFNLLANLSLLYAHYNSCNSSQIFFYIFLRRAFSTVTSFCASFRFLSAYSATSCCRPCGRQRPSALISSVCMGSRDSFIHMHVHQFTSLSSIRATTSAQINGFPQFTRHASTNKNLPSLVRAILSWLFFLS